MTRASQVTYGVPAYRRTVGVLLKTMRSAVRTGHWSQARQALCSHLSPCFPPARLELPVWPTLPGYSACLPCPHCLPCLDALPTTLFPAPLSHGFGFFFSCFHLPSASAAASSLSPPTVWTQIRTFAIYVNDWLRNLRVKQVEDVVIVNTEPEGEAHALALALPLRRPQ